MRKCTIGIDKCNMYVPKLTPVCKIMKLKNHKHLTGKTGFGVKTQNLNFRHTQHTKTET